MDASPVLDLLVLGIFEVRTGVGLQIKPDYTPLNPSRGCRIGQSPVTPIQTARPPTDTWGFPKLGCRIWIIQFGLKVWGEEGEITAPKPFRVWVCSATNNGDYVRKTIADEMVGVYRD